MLINKTIYHQGPILSSVFGVHELLKEGLLNVNVIFLIEGEEESGSHGFLEALTKHQVYFIFSFFAFAEQSSNNYHSSY